MKILNPIFEEKQNQYFELTKHRFFTMFKPIQKTKKKQSDFFAYLANPVIDVLISPLFSFDVSIHLLNACASLGKAFYLWSINQEKKASMLDPDSKKEFKQALIHFTHSGSSFVAHAVNIFLSLISLVTRPFASLGQAIYELMSNKSPSPAPVIPSTLATI